MFEAAQRCRERKDPLKSKSSFEVISVFVCFVFCCFFFLSINQCYSSKLSAPSSRMQSAFPETSSSSHPSVHWWGCKPRQRALLKTGLNGSVNGDCSNERNGDSSCVPSALRDHQRHWSILILAPLFLPVLGYWRGNSTRANLSEYVMQLDGLFIKRFCLFPFLSAKVLRDLGNLQLK